MVLGVHARRSTAVLGALALIAMILALVPAPVQAAAKRGTIRMSVSTPKGVAATVVAARGKTRVSAAKTASGTSRTVSRKVVPGTWKISAKPVQVKGRFYVANVRPPRPKVRAGKTTRVKVTYKVAKTVTHLKVSSIGKTSIGVTFTKPKTSTPVKIRFAKGTKAPSKVNAGRAVPVGPKARKAKASRLKAGTTYSISVFTKVGKKWVGPVKVTAGTTAAKSSSSFVASPATVLVKSADKVPARVTSGGVSAKMPGAITPVVGQPVVLPISRALPGGFVGKVSKVGSNGRTVTLRQAALTEAFDYLDVTVPDLGAAGNVRTSVANSPGSMRPVAQVAKKKCALSSGKGITMPAPQFTHGGYFNLTVKTDRVLLADVPQGVSIDTKVSVTGTMKIAAHLDGSLSCAIPISALTRTFMAGPVPMVVQFTPEASFEAKGSVKFTGVGVTATAGLQGKAYVPLPGKGKYSSSASPIKNVTWLKPSVTAAGSLGMKIGGALAIGPGGGANIAGVQAGISGSLYPLDAKATITAGSNTPWCLDASAKGTASAKIFAKAWAGDYSSEAKYDFINQSASYGSYDYPNGCRSALTAWSSVSAGSMHTCGLRGGGQLWCWGYNPYGALGLGDTTDRSRPARVGSASDWTSVSPGTWNTCGIRSGGQLWCWGNNEYGQLGLGDDTNRLQPARVGTASNWNIVSTGFGHVCGVRSDGQLWCWGSNSYRGQLGIGDDDSAVRREPVRVGAASDWTNVSVFDHQACGLRAGGQLWCWGSNYSGVLGTGDRADRREPVRIGDAADWRSVSTGASHACGLRMGGQVWCWGSNSSGDLGVGDTNDRLRPTRVGSGTEWASISAGYHTCAVRPEDQLWCWGSNFFGELGIGDHGHQLRPAKVLEPSNWGQVSVGGHICAVRPEGALWCWGHNASGALGIGTPAREYEDRPREVG